MIIVRMIIFVPMRRGQCLEFTSCFQVKANNVKIALQEKHKKVPKHEV